MRKRMRLKLRWLSSPPGRIETTVYCINHKNYIFYSDTRGSSKSFLPAATTICLLRIKTRSILFLEVIYMNELFLVITLLVSFGGTLLFLKVFGKGGLFAWIGICTVLANIEVTILVHAFGMDQTLGNTLFAATFLATDILSEIYGKKDANKGVLAGIFTSLSFILLSFMWVRYIPAEGDWSNEFVRGLFSNTPRMLLSSLIAYVISEFIDVSLYHVWWKLTEKKTGSHTKMLWFRNNFSTLISQFVNIVLFNFGAFLGIYTFRELLAITASCYVIYVATSLLDTPFVYLARKIAAKTDASLN